MNDFTLIPNYDRYLSDLVEEYYGESDCNDDDPRDEYYPEDDDLV